MYKVQDKILIVRGVVVSGLCTIEEVMSAEVCDRVECIGRVV